MEKKWGGERANVRIKECRKGEERREALLDRKGSGKEKEKKRAKKKIKNRRKGGKKKVKRREKCRKCDASK